MKIIYIEEEVIDHPRTTEICRRFPQATVIRCERYGEIFNRKGQNFRLQKRQPALILARKHNNFVLDAPEGYGIGGSRNYYFSHMLNCVYDCRYCFLQGMYRSANYLLFVNYEEFQHQIIETICQHQGKETWFFSGYDCDSLAYDPVSGFVDAFLPLFAQHTTAHLELRTKSTQIRGLLRQRPIDNCVIAFSFTPDEISQALEHGVPAIEKRLDAMEKLQRHGWRLGLRFDPLIYQQDYQTMYLRLFDSIFSRLDRDAIHSVSLGAFRMPKGFHDNIVRLYPDEKLFAGALEEQQGMIGYRQPCEASMLGFCRETLLEYIPESLFFSCTPPHRKPTSLMVANQPGGF